MVGEINKKRQLIKHVILLINVLLIIIYNVLYKHNENYFFEKNLLNILDTNRKELGNFLKDNSKEMKWIEIAMFDFTQDGESEIIISKVYVEKGMMSPVSKNMVFKQSGDKILEFIGGYFKDIELCKILEGEELFIIEDNIHNGAGNDLKLYIELYIKDNEWTHEMKYVNWCVQSEANTNKGFVYDNITKEEENGIWAGYNGFVSCFQLRETTSYENMEKYLNSLEYIKKIKVVDVGAFYYEGEDKYIWHGNNLYANNSFKRRIEKSFNQLKDTLY